MSIPMPEAVDVSYYATWGSAALFLIAAGFMGMESKWLGVMLYGGLFCANGAIALISIQTL